MMVALAPGLRYERSLPSLAPIGPVQPCTQTDERDAGVENRVTDEMHEALVAKRPRDTEHLSAKNEHDAR